MTIRESDNTTITGTADLKRIIRRRWPDALYSDTRDCTRFSTGIPALDRLFRDDGIPHGQILEINGNTSSGKTSVLFRSLAEHTACGVVTYLDFSGTFFPAAAQTSGVDISRLLVVSPENVREGLRAAELILRENVSSCIVFDMVGVRGKLPVTLLHRLRQSTLKSNALMIFLTEGKSELIPASMISIGLHIERMDPKRILASITKSRISISGTQAVIEL